MIQIDYEKQKICRTCGAVDSQRVVFVRRQKNGTLRYWRCKACGAHGVRICYTPHSTD